jgi:hypothetical protein
MRRTQFAAVLLLALPVVCWAGNYVVPTTTLTAQTANNTSAANSFWTQTNGNLGAGNVSKVNVHSLLYPGSTTKIYAHLMLWFGKSNHMNVGYSSNDAAQVELQIDDMISRGIDGVIIDWYGPNTFVDDATKVVMAEAEKHPGFTFAIMIDQGAIKWDSCAGCTPQEALISDLQYIEQEYFPSPAYMRWQGAPIVTNFDIDSVYAIDWNAANAALATHPAFLFQNNGGFTHVLSEGSYSWVMPSTTDYGMSYLTSFYNTGMPLTSEETVGAAYKGFDDTLASWGSRRTMKQRCGQTWLQTFSKVNGLYNSGKQLPYLQLVTWNDYEEGSEIESGIDSCFSLSGSVSGQTFQWNISGDESTVDHYRVYISTDGQNLMTLTDTAPGLRSINLCSFSIPAGNYKLFVQAVGKPSLANRMPGPVSYTPGCGTGSGGGSGTLSFTASPAALTIPAGKSGTITISAKPESGSYNSSISLSCALLPANLGCTFSPEAITPGSGTAASALTITTVSVAGKNLPQRGGGLVYASWLLSFGVAGFAFFGNLQHRRRLQVALFACALIGGSMLTTSCGGGASATQGASAPKTYTIAVHGNSGSSQVSANVLVTVQ